MWSHYGDNHKGVCLGYRLNKIENNAYFGKVEYKGLKTKKMNNSLNLVSGEIEKNIEDFSYNDNFKIDEDIILTDIFFRKNENWKYEKEYRFIYFNDDEEYYSEVELVEVIFGIETSDIDKKIIKKLLKDNKNISYFKTKQEEGVNIKSKPLSKKELKELE